MGNQPARHIPGIANPLPEQAHADVILIAFRRGIENVMKRNHAAFPHERPVQQEIFRHAFNSVIAVDKGNRGGSPSGVLRPCAASVVRDYPSGCDGSVTRSAPHPARPKPIRCAVVNANDYRPSAAVWHQYASVPP